MKSSQSMKTSKEGYLFQQWKVRGRGGEGRGGDGGEGLTHVTREGEGSSCSGTSL